MSGIVGVISQEKECSASALLLLASRQLFNIEEGESVHLQREQTNKEREEGEQEGRENTGPGEKCKNWTISKTMVVRIEDLHRLHDADERNWSKSWSKREEEEVLGLVDNNNDNEDSRGYQSDRGDRDQQTLCSCELTTFGCCL